MPTDEQERLKRLRDKQLNARDPLVKQRQFQRSSSVKEKRMRKPFSFKKALAEDIPHVVKMPFYGLLLGILVLLILPNLWMSQWAVIVAGALTLGFIIFGVVMGSSLDLRDDIRRHIK
jgi:uncharacterized membrane protein